LIVLKAFILYYSVFRNYIQSNLNKSN